MATTSVPRPASAPATVTSLIERVEREAFLRGYRRGIQAAEEDARWNRIFDQHFDGKLEAWRQSRRDLLTWMETHLPERVPMEG